MDGEGELLALVARVSEGDTGAADTLVRRVYPRVRGLVHRELEQRFRAAHRWILPLFSTSDVVQDVLTDVVRGLDECEFPGEGAFVRYLATMVRNRLISAVRFHEAARRDGRRDVEEQTGVGDRSGTLSGPELAASLAERAAAVRTVLDTFPQRARALLEARLLDGATFPEVAEQLGYASAETARQSFCELQAKLVLRLRAKGIRPSG